MKYDELLVELGEFGRYQKFLYFLVGLVSITSAFHAMNMVFVGPAPEHLCAIRASGNQTGGNPLMFESGEAATADVCYITDDVTNHTTDDGSIHEKLCTEWLYSKTYYTSTIVTEWDLVCSKSWLDEISSTIFFFGRLMGALLSGPLSDKFGRRPVFFSSLVAQVILGCIAAASPALWFFYVVYFLQGAVQVSVFLTAFVMGTELVGPRYRKTTGISVQFFFASGQIILTGIAYWIRKWRLILVAISLPSVLFFSYYWLLPESIRWLLVKGKRKEAKELIFRTAKYNKVTLDDNVMDVLEGDDEKETKNKTYTVLDIIRNRAMIKIAAIVWFNWFVNALVYYGLSLNSSKLHGDPYLNFLLLAGVEIPALAISILLLDRVGRRYLMLIFMMIGAAGCFVTAITLDNPILSAVFSIIGKFGITGSYGIIYLFTVEVFPTIVRNNGIGMASVCARIAGIIAPLCLNLTDLWPPLSMVVFGITSVLGGLLCLLLPETTGKPLTQDIKEMQKTFNTDKKQLQVEETEESKPMKNTENI